MLSDPVAVSGSEEEAAAQEVAFNHAAAGEGKAADDGLVGGHSSSEDGEDEDDGDAEARIYAELLEEQAAKNRAAALEGLNDINTGQAGWGAAHPGAALCGCAPCSQIMGAVPHFRHSAGSNREDRSGTWGEAQAGRAILPMLAM